MRFEIDDSGELDAELSDRLREKYSLRNALVLLGPELPYGALFEPLGRTAFRCLKKFWSPTAFWVLHGAARSRQQPMLFPNCRRSMSCKWQVDWRHWNFLKTRLIWCIAWRAPDRGPLTLFFADVGGRSSSG